MIGSEKCAEISPRYGLEPSALIAKATADLGCFDFGSLMISFLRESFFSWPCLELYILQLFFCSLFCPKKRKHS